MTSRVRVANTDAMSSSASRYGGGLARADDRYAVGTLRIRERGELPVWLLFKLLVGKGSEGVRPGSCGYKHSAISCVSLRGR